MTPPRTDESTADERRRYVLEEWRCLNDCEACGKCRILRGRDPETLYAEYINGTKEYIEVTLQFRR